MNKKKIVFLGNSIVNGYPLPRSQCFVSLYRNATGHEVINKGQNGSVTSESLRRLEDDVISHKPDEMWFMGGTNDYIMNVTDPKGTLNLLVKIANKLKSENILPIFMIPLPIDPDMASKLWFPEPDYIRISLKIVELRKLMLEYGRETGIRIIDTYTFFSSLYDDTNKEDYLYDGLHPTALGHRAIADFLLSL
ncbi:MAG: GDSL-type esterase/lipase family protein [Anaerovoracaceae bacterium]